MKAKHSDGLRLSRVSTLVIAASLASGGALAADNPFVQQRVLTAPATAAPQGIQLGDVRPQIDRLAPPPVITRPGVELPQALLELPLVRQGLVGLGRAGEFGTLVEVKREPRRGIETEGLDLTPKLEEDELEKSDALEHDLTASLAVEQFVPPMTRLQGRAAFEFFDVPSRRTFAYSVDRTVLAKYSRTVGLTPDENTLQRRPAGELELRLEDMVGKAWSNASDQRTRRGIADGFADTHSIYQSLADYGGCSATVLSANWQRMVAITAAHCVFTAGNNFSTSRLRPRRDGGTSPTWGSWRAVGFGYYPQYLNNDCEDNWNGNRCIRHDIALVIARPDPGAVPPQGMGWGYRPKSFLDSHSKYRRGYPGCGFGHSPANCTTNTLYGDGRLSVGNFSKRDGDGWNRQLRHSSDTNPGDSGSSLYYYRNGNPYVFAVHSASPSCAGSCLSSRPNAARRITPQFFDFINSVVN